MKRLQVAAGIIENQNGQILLAQRPTGKHLAGMWEFPGGKIEAGESVSEALKRELKEELHLDVEVLEALGQFPYAYEWGSLDLHVLRVRALSAPLATEHVRQFRWVRPREIAVVELAGADREPLKVYLSSPSVR